MGKKELERKGSEDPNGAVSALLIKLCQNCFFHKVNSLSYF
jgi:hypothetical protein